MQRFSQGEFVWHKTKGWPWWPSKVLAVVQTSDGDRYDVVDLGTHDFAASIDGTTICPWHSKKPLKKLKDTMQHVYSEKDRRSYEKAVSEVLANQQPDKRPAGAEGVRAPKVARSCGPTAQNTVLLTDDDDESEVKVDTEDQESDSDDGTVALAKKLLSIDKALTKAKAKVAAKRDEMNARRAAAAEMAKAADDKAAAVVADLEEQLRNARKAKEATAAKHAALQAQPARDAELESLIAKEQKLAAEKKEVKTAMRS